MIEEFIKLYNEGKVPMSTMLKAAAFKEELEKVSFGGDLQSFLTYLAAGMGVSLGLGGAAALAETAVGAYQKHKLESSADPLFQEVLQLHPELKENKALARLYFDALMHFSPAVASNPLTAGAYIRQALAYHEQMGGPLPETVNTLTNIQKSVIDSKSKAGGGPFATLISGIKNMPTTISAQKVLDQ